MTVLAALVVPGNEREQSCHPFGKYFPKTLQQRNIHFMLEQLSLNKLIILLSIYLQINKNSISQKAVARQRNATTIAVTVPGDFTPKQCLDIDSLFQNFFF